MTDQVDALVIFGATGDLAKLETFPALVGLVAKHFGADTAAERLQIVLTPPTWNVRPLAVRSETSRPMPTDRPLAA